MKHTLEVYNLKNNVQGWDDLLSTMGAEISKDDPLVEVILYFIHFEVCAHCDRPRKICSVERGERFIMNKLTIRNKLLFENARIRAESLDEAGKYVEELMQLQV